MSASAPSEPPREPTPRRGLRQRMRALRVRTRGGGRVELTGRPIIGAGVRFDVAPGARVVVGDGASLGERCRVHAHGGTVTIGAGAVLGERCVIAARAGVIIGERCLLGDEVAIIDFDHRTDEVETPVRLQGLISSPVHIDAGAVLGPRVAILRGVHVGAGALVGAHSVVTREVPAGATVQGTPARSAAQARERRPSTRGAPMPDA